MFSVLFLIVPFLLDTSGLDFQVLAYTIQITPSLGYIDDYQNVCSFIPSNRKAGNS
jgi:hypothetical protein